MRALMLLCALLWVSSAQSTDIKDVLADVLGQDEQEEQDQSTSDDHSTDADSARGSDATPDQMVGGVREALARGVDTAISQLGQEDGFLGDDIVRIPVPDSLDTVASAARKLGRGSYVDEFEVAMNRAAEQAVPATAEVFGDAIREMSVTDVRDIIGGGDTAATDYFRRTSGEALVERVLPIVSEATSAGGVTDAYKRLEDKAGGLLGSPLLGGGSDDLDLDRYVTSRAIDGLFHYIGQQEQAIREDPVARTTDLLKAVFGG